MNLSIARLCLECSEVFSRAKGAKLCPVCASQTSWPLASFIDRAGSSKNGKETQTDKRNNLRKGGKRYEEANDQRTSYQSGRSVA